MTPTELETYLHTHIPLTAAMQVRAVTVTPEQVVLGAPLQPNINVHHTVFGGSASTLAVLSAWSLLHVRLLAQGYSATLVIRQQTMSYEQPLVGEFTAQAQAPDAEAWTQFTHLLERRGRARITLQAVVQSEGRVGGRFSGEFVALPEADGQG